MQGVALEVEADEDRGHQLLVPGADADAQVLAGRVVVLPPVDGREVVHPRQLGPTGSHRTVVGADRRRVAALLDGQPLDAFVPAGLVAEFRAHPVGDVRGDVVDGERQDGLALHLVEVAPGRLELLAGGEAVLRCAEQELGVRPVAQRLARSDEGPETAVEDEAGLTCLFAVDLADQGVGESAG